TIELEDAKTRATADDIARDFETQAKRRGANAQLRRVSCDALDAPAIAAATARLFDLTIMPVAAGSRADRELAEGIVFGSGRPCLLLPQHWNAESFLLDRPLIAWDASRAATRALADALPLLLRAKDVFVVAVAAENTAPASTLRDVERWLADHGVRANSALVDGMGRSAAMAIGEHAREVRANMLVMGAFGHSRLRDFILGGVTRSVLAEPKIPILFSH
ncbi:MAG: universal stress protein, partial [Beijerinckiaceae bacterium]|nr:universal stress protein [Beijerinckiaceae bacterium]